MGNIGMSKNYIYSTLTSSVRYALWKKGGQDLKVKDSEVLIKGGANVADKNFVTPQGVITIVTDEQLAALEENKVFRRHRARGFLTVVRDAKKAEVEEVVSDMVGRDPSAPLVPEDYDAENAAAPKVNTHIDDEPTEEAPKPPVKPKSSGKDVHAKDSHGKGNKSKETLVPTPPASE
jgi:hypothetical protein